MKTYPHPHSHSIGLPIPQPTFLKRSVFLLLATLVTYFAFAGNGQNSSGNGTPVNGEFNLPLVLKSFNVSVNHKKVNLNWVTGHEKDLSHFVIERSTNGVDYTEVAIVFAGGSSATQKYNYRDVVVNCENGIVYYRLKLMDTQKRHQYSLVRTIRVAEMQNAVAVQAYPNPVVKELRITVPAEWQNRQVNYELYNMNGNLVKRVSTNNASQTETVNVQELTNGSYVMKAYTDNEITSQLIVKK